MRRSRRVAKAQSTGRREDRRFGPQGRETLPKALARREADYWSDDTAASQTAECELFLATRQDRKQRADLRGRMPKGLSARGRKQRSRRTRHGRAVDRQRGASGEPVFGPRKERQDAGRFSMRSRVACCGKWHMQAAPTTCGSYPGCPPRQISHGAAHQRPQDRAARRLKHAKDVYPPILNHFKRQRSASQQQAPWDENGPNSKAAAF